MTVNVPWSTLRPNPRDQRERAAAANGFPAGAQGTPSGKDGETEIAWDVTDFGKRMAFGGIVSNAPEYAAIGAEKCVFACPLGRVPGREGWSQAVNAAVEYKCLLGHSISLCTPPTREACAPLSSSWTVDRNAVADVSNCTLRCAVTRVDPAGNLPNMRTGRRRHRHYFRSE